MRPRHVPIRTCSGCRQERPKREMVRVVRSPDGAVSVDETGKRSGRGAYVCLSAECWAKALRGSLAHQLKIEISSADQTQLERFAEQFREQKALAST